jgi:hypothetical protein
LKSGSEGRHLHSFRISSRSLKQGKYSLLLLVVLAWTYRLHGSIKLVITNSLDSLPGPLSSSGLMGSSSELRSSGSALLLYFGPGRLVRLLGRLGVRVSQPRWSELGREPGLGYGSISEKGPMGRNLTKWLLRILSPLLSARHFLLSSLSMVALTR